MPLKIYYVLFSVVIFATALSCRKDEEISGMACETCDSPDTLKMGTTTNMTTFSPGFLYDSYPYENDSIIIDMENDGIPDFKIKTYVYSLGVMVGYFPHTTIESMNDAAWYSFSATDTTYAYVDTTYYGSSPTYREVNYHSTCVAHPPYDSVTAVNDKVCYYAAGDYLLMTSHWTGDKTYLHSPSYTVNLAIEPAINDTITTYKAFHTYTCKDIPSTSTYIGVKKLTSGQERLGWIKLTVSNFGWHVVVEETAIQQGIN